MPQYTIRHITKYTYPEPVIDGANQIMLTPISDSVQQVQKHEITITGKPLMETFTDYFGNIVIAFTMITPHSELVVQSVFDVTTHPIALPNEIMAAATQWHQLRMDRQTVALLDFVPVEQCASRQEILMLIKQIAPLSLTPFGVAKALSEFIFDNFEYKKGITSVESGIDEIWKLRAGVCQDFANILLVMLRCSGVPSRYVSGYICPKNHDLRGEGATHAWVEAYIPFHGWIGIDPTNNCIASDRHVRLSVGRNFRDCTPVKGLYKGSGEHTLAVSVNIVNGGGKKEYSSGDPVPVFGYTVRRTGPVDNSYRKFVEMQQQQ